MNLFIQKIIFLQRAEIGGNKQKRDEKFGVEPLTSSVFSSARPVTGDVLRAGGDASDPLGAGPPLHYICSGETARFASFTCSL